MPIIKLKRGNKTSLPILNAGEAAFTMDTKEFFVGDGINNFSMTPINNNILVNSNFQHSLAISEVVNSGGTSLIGGVGKYIFGNYYVSNKTGTSGIVNIFGPQNSSGRLIFMCNDGYPTLEYRVKLPRIYQSSKYKYISLLDNHILTLSFDFINNTSNLLTFFTGQPNSLKSITMPNGSTRFSTTFTYNKTTLSPSNIDCMDIVIAKFDTSTNASFEIGNIKLEESSKQTPYYINSLQQDMASIETTYKIINTVLKATVITQNTLEFHIQNDMSLLYDYNPRFNILSTILLSNNGTAQTSYSPEVSYDTRYNTIKILVNKNAHGLADASLAVKLEIDYRPYESVI
ncbi:MAG: hypothetical protein RSB76_02780 [Clostridia bacterium]